MVLMAVPVCTVCTLPAMNGKTGLKTADDTWGVADAGLEFSTVVRTKAMATMVRPKRIGGFPR
jgi:hypothetical protein